MTTPAEEFGDTLSGLLNGEAVAPELPQPPAGPRRPQPNRAQGTSDGAQPVALNPADQLAQIVAAGSTNAATFMPGSAGSAVAAGKAAGWRGEHGDRVVGSS